VFFSEAISALIFPVVLSRQIEKEPFQIAGNQNIHRGGHGGVKIAVRVIDAGPDKIGQDVVRVGGAQDFPDRGPHPLRVIGREDIPEISGGHADVDLLVFRKPAFFHQVAAGRNIINDLRKQPSEVDGVGGGKDIAVFQQLFLQPLVRENVLHAGLGVVEIPLTAAT
jgi:hypothetical protein